MHQKLLFALISAAILSGCAGHRYTHEKFGSTDKQLGQLSQRDVRIESSLNRLEETQKRDVARLDETQKRDVARIDEAHQREVARIDETHQREVARIDETHQRDVARLEETHLRDVARIDEAHQREVARIDDTQRKDVARIDETQRKDVARLDADIKETLRIAKGKFAYTTSPNQTDVPFAIGSAKVGNDDLQALENMARQLLSANKNVYVEIRGFTDAAGSERQNQSLALARAEAVRAALNESGVPLHRMSVIALPDRADGAKQSAEERARNRRVTISIVE